MEIDRIKSKHENGFTAEEIKNILNDYPNISINKFNDSLSGNTVKIIGDEIIHYKHDIKRAIHFAIQNR